MQTEYRVTTDKLIWYLLCPRIYKGKSEQQSGHPKELSNESRWAWGARISERLTSRSDWKGANSPILSYQSFFFFNKCYLGIQQDEPFVHSNHSHKLRTVPSSWKIVHAIIRSLEKNLDRSKAKPHKAASLASAFEKLLKSMIKETVLKVF